MPSHGARENEFWEPEVLWPGETLFIVAGGPSLRGFDFGRLAGRRIVAVNVAAYDVEHQDPPPAWYFMDANIYEDNEVLVRRWRGPVFSASRRAKGQCPDIVRRLDIEERRDFIAPGSRAIKAGRSSGHTAISLGVRLGAARIVMLGFDGTAVDGQTHYHDRYAPRAADGAVYAEFRAAFEGWHGAGRRAGCEIVNATPGSAIAEFPHVGLDDELRRKTC